MKKYSDEFKIMIEDFLSQRKGLKRYEVYIEQEMKLRYQQIVEEVIPEMEYHFNNLSNMEILDYGCGTGATTVALAEKCKNVVGADIDRKSLEICKKRAVEHGVADKVTVVYTNELKKFTGKKKFDLVLMNGVIEHIPMSAKGLRREVIRDAFSYVKRGGYLYINDTPCRLWPKDIHTTGLWLISYLPSGSMTAFKYAVKYGKHNDTALSPKYGAGLEERGVWGSTYWEIVRALRGESFHCINTDEGHNKKIFYRKKSKARRQMLEFMMYSFFGKMFDIPIAAFSSYLNHLIFKKI